MLFLIDENVRREVAKFLEGYGEIAYVQKGASDSSVAEIAIAENRILVTQDKDFANQLVYPPEKFSGIIVIKIHPPTVQTITNAFRQFFEKEAGIHIAGHIVLLSADGFVIYPDVA
jgi:predicted nuclease of predicted toxin-antitoxin system